MRIAISWIVIIGGALAAFAQSPPSTWEHNGSTVQLFANGAKRQFYYQNPRPGMQQEGVRPGTLLFDGQRRGSQYSGTAYMFSRACGAVGYAVSGAVSADDRQVTLYGNAPRLDAYCRVSGSAPDVLIFNFAALPQADAETINRENVRTIICIHPVFTEEKRLENLIFSAGDAPTAQASGRYVAEAVKYLRDQYCRPIEGTLTADQRTAIPDTNCYQESGIFRGERVYWGECYE
jgi:hypothetical protein